MQDKGLKKRKNSGKTSHPSPKVLFRPHPEDFRIFGREGIDQETLAQMTTAMRLPVAVKGALMPDAHVGYGLPIGGVLAAYNAVIPFGVGMDIGCRMCLSVYPLPSGMIEKEKEKLKHLLVDNTRFGNSFWHDSKDNELLDRKEWKEIGFLRGLKSIFAEQLGTSGHGNHFVDIGEFTLPRATERIPLLPGNYFAVLSHSGSRNFGAEVCRHYTSVAREKLGLSGLEGWLAWLDLGHEEGQEYWMAMQLAGEYSRTNHHLIHERLSRALAEKPLWCIENHHNFAWKELLPDGREMIIHRKGATLAGTGDMGIIPGTMASPAYIVAGKGNPESLNSAAHGAGRSVSRTKAKAIFNETDLLVYLKKEGIELIGGNTEESPLAYKDIHQVMAAQQEMVETLAFFHPKIVRME